MSSIAVQVADIDATVEFLAHHGVRVASRVGGHIVFTHPADTAGVVIEWFGAEESLDPHFGGRLPPPPPDPLLQVEQMAFAGAVVDDPLAAADRLAVLFGREVTFRADDRSEGVPLAGVSMGDMTLALYPLPPSATSRRLWGHDYDRAQTCNLGIRVPDLVAATAALRANDVAIVRSGEGAVVIDPATTGGVTLVVVDELLAGDPRR
jgi:hypothetical protein